MRHRKLRIALSVAWGAVAVLLCVLWVRSYWWTDSIFYQQNRTFLGVIRTTAETTLGSERGFVGVVWQDSSNFTNGAWDIRSQPTGPATEFGLGIFGIGYEDAWFGNMLVVRHGTLATLALFASFAPWLPFKRFSLRTLLIATTLVALLLGLIIYATRG